MKIFDFHLHEERQHAVFNLIAGRDSIPSTGFFSAGIHPWFIENLQNQYKTLNEIIINSRCIAIGECGLDRLKGPDLKIQIEIFKKHIQWAEELKKPLIIHCVKAHNELLQIKKETKSSVQWIIHGYNQNLTIAERLLENGFMFSLGKPLLHPASNAGKLLRIIPKDRFFLETDSDTVTIEEIYQSAAEILALPIQDLVFILHQNFKRVFPGYE